MGVIPPLEGPPAHERTLEEFVGKDPAVDEAFGYWNEEAFLLDRAPHLGERKVRLRHFFCTEPSVYWTPEGPHPFIHCYSLAVLDADPTYAVLLADMIDAETRVPSIEDNVVGEFYVDDFEMNILGILEAHRGKGVGPHFVAAAVEETGNVDPSRAYSPAGLRNRMKAHKILIHNAILRGDKVPERVLKDYPDLKKLAAKK